MGLECPLFFSWPVYKFTLGWNTVVDCLRERSPINSPHGSHTKSQRRRAETSLSSSFQDTRKKHLSGLFTLHTSPCSSLLLPAHSSVFPSTPEECFGKVCGNPIGHTLPAPPYSSLLFLGSAVFVNSI